MLFSPTLIQGHEVTSFKPTVDLLAYQGGGGGGWVNSFLIFDIPHEYIYTQIHMYMYGPTPADTFTDMHTHTHVCVHLTVNVWAEQFECIHI